MPTAKMTTQAAPEEVTDRIFTAANVISFARLCLIPVYLYLLFAGYDVAAMVVFAVAALTDFLDGQVARRTHTVSKLGKLMDPAIDTLLMMTGVIGTCLVGRCPVWVVVLIIAREAFLLGGGAVLLRRFHIQVPVVYPGKVASTRFGLDGYPLAAGFHGRAGLFGDLGRLRGAHPPDSCHHLLLHPSLWTSEDDEVPPWPIAAASTLTLRIGSASLPRRAAATVTARVGFLLTEGPAPSMMPAGIAGPSPHRLAPRPLVQPHHRE